MSTNAIRCPNCRAETTGSTTCRRCRADLTLLVQLEVERSFWLRTSAEHVRDGNLDDALECLAAADDLRPGVDVRRLRAAVLLLAGDREGAMREHQLLATSPAS